MPRFIGPGSRGSSPVTNCAADHPFRGSRWQGWRPCATGYFRYESGFSGCGRFATANAYHNVVGTGHVNRAARATSCPKPKTQNRNAGPVIPLLDRVYVHSLELILPRLVSRPSTYSAICSPTRRRLWLDRLAPINCSIAASPSRRPPRSPRWRRPARPCVADAGRAQCATSALTWVEAEHPESVPEGDGVRQFALEAPFHAIAPTWSGEAGGDVLVEISVSGEWREAGPIRSPSARRSTMPARPIATAAASASCIFADGASLVRYRAMDSAGEI